MSMDSTIINEFKDKNIAKVKEHFFEYLGEDSVWFGKVLYDVKERWMNKGSMVTDLIIRQSEPIMLSVVKSNILYSFPTGEPEFRPNSTAITDVVSKFHKKENEKIGWEGLIVDFSFSVKGLGVFRINFSNDNNGARLAIRILSYNLPDFNFVGYPPFFMTVIESMVHKVNVLQPSSENPGEMEMCEAAEIADGGLILHVGPTGSGKTTAIAAEFGYLAERTAVQMLTYENPIEYRYISTAAIVSQFEIGKDVRKTEDYNEFESASRHLLRNNPSAVLIGEARTHSEMRTVLDIASRGHLVFGTMHASNVLEALNTLSGAVKDDRHLLSSIKAIIAHKLVRNSDGQVFGLHEILIIDPIIQNHLLKGDVQAIKNLMYLESSSAVQKQTFLDALIELEGKGKLKFNERRRIEDNNRGTFIGKTDKK
jgi:Tfp pilus assembly pilus retraction ATPase PilT